MAMSNVRSSAYRAAGGKAWNRTKSGMNGIVFDGPQPEWMVEQRHRMQDADDRNAIDKAAVRKQLEAGYDESLVTVVPAGKSGKKRVKK